jgi:glucose 1-dehydrogenase
MVNNAGIETRSSVLDSSEHDFDLVIGVNLKGAFFGTQLAAKQMIKQGGGGRIINISSVHEDMAMPTNAPYCAAKGGVRMLMRTLAVELAPHGITVNNVCPGAIDTKMDAGLKADADEFEILLDEIPLHRMGTPGEVADLCVFLASQGAAYVTGASYLIDGGMTKNAGSL